MFEMMLRERTNMMFSLSAFIVHDTPVDNKGFDKVLVNQLPTYLPYFLH